MKLSVIIVNFNVKHFLEQCLYSVQKALEGVDGEVLVVDNHSADNSLEYLAPSFPQVRFIANAENRGFARACNQGLAESGGQYILFLNPDTIVPEDCFRTCIEFLDTHPEAGALGVRMVDGSGKFLKESKRSFPSPLTSLYKLFGLARLFPRSRIFSRYHLGHLDEHQTNEVDVLAGAFMMIKREVLDKTGSFDETFFMYGEDVDLSYRIQQAGYKNFYFAGTGIIHFKGESTRKGSMNYVRMFYSAMSKFVRKHYGGGRAGFFHFLVQAGIWFRAGLTALGSFIRRAGLPLIDAGLILLSFWLAKNIWNEYVRTEIHYESRLLWIAFPSFTLFYLITAYYAGLYDRWYHRSELLRSTVVATIVLLAGYALLPEQYRFSRAIILLGAALAFLFISLLRWILIRTRVLNSRKEKEEHFNTLVAGTQDEYIQVTELMNRAGQRQKLLGRVAVEEDEVHALGHIRQLKKFDQVVPFREIIFCQGRLHYRDILERIGELPPGVSVKIFASGSGSIVGSHSRNVSGEYVSDENGFLLSNPYNRRLKRGLDIITAITGLLIFPFQFFIQRKPLSFFQNCFRVLGAARTWVGYAIPSKSLPPLRKAVLASNGLPVGDAHPLGLESLQMMDYWYARDYDPARELRLIWKNYRRLGG